MSVTQTASDKIVPVEDLAVGSWFTLNGQDCRVVQRWSTGVQVINHYAEKRVISGATLVEL